MLFEERPRHGGRLEEYSFDELAKGMASGTISRSRALKMAGAALLGAVLVPFSAAPAEARRRNPCKGKPAITTEFCPIEEAACKRTDPGCVCTTTTEGDKRCVHFTTDDCPTFSECESSSECPGRRVCIPVGACCFFTPNLCVRPCR
jgi:hypothetical protein